jgi:hypothetical protein
MMPSRCDLGSLTCGPFVSTSEPISIVLATYVPQARPSVAHATTDLISSAALPSSSHTISYHTAHMAVLSYDPPITERYAPAEHETSCLPPLILDSPECRPRRRYSNNSPCWRPTFYMHVQRMLFPPFRGKTKAGVSILFLHTRLYAKVSG